MKNRLDHLSRLSVKDGALDVGAASARPGPRSGLVRVGKAASADLGAIRSALSDGRRDPPGFAECVRLAVAAYRDQLEGRS